MSLTKAAEALNKILSRSECQRETCLLSKPPLSSAHEASQCPDSYLNENNTICRTWNRETDTEDQEYSINGPYDQTHESLCYQTFIEGKNICDFKNKVKHSGIVQALSSPSPIGTVESSKGLAVYSLSQQQPNIFPFIEKILNVDGSSSVRFTTLNTVDLGDFTPLDPNKYKTELCRSYQVHGYCKYGIRCNYAHGLTQLRVSFRHGKYKTRNCQSYHETGFCRYGARCSFIHDAEEGILKCPITDREVLEALHYRPMSEFHHIATITWRILEQNCYPPTEVHFFTPANHQAISEISFDQSLCMKEISESDSSSKEISSTGEIDKFIIKEEGKDSICAESNFINIYFNSLSPEKQSNKVKITEMEDLEEQNSSPVIQDTGQSTDLDLLYSPNSVPEVSNDSTQFSFSQKEKEKRKGSYHYRGNTRQRIIDVQKTKSKSSLKDSNRPGYNLVPRSDKISKSSSPLCNSEKDVPSGQNAWTKHSTQVEKKSNSSTPSKNFKLDDFFKCLKTREGKQHLASWTPETERKTSICESSSPSSGFQKTSSESTSSWGSFKCGRDLSKYKTELCRSYQYNRFCEYNDSCLYAHGKEDLRSYPKHPLYRTKKCFSFHKKGFCLYGSRCQFLHDIEIPMIQ